MVFWKKSGPHFFHSLVGSRGIFSKQGNKPLMRFVNSIWITAGGTDQSRLAYCTKCWS